MQILSLFDGMACGMLALQGAEVQVDRYVAYEIDKYAIKTAKHNFPMIEEKGDVFTADFAEYLGFDFLVGGSPCTYWSIAQSPDKRETTASGLGWELFSQYNRALVEAKPRFFIYENNKSMSKEIRASITETFGFEPYEINSALVSAQNRQRLYWVGKRNLDGSYSKVDVEQPADQGILLRDILDGIGSKELTEGEIDYMVRTPSGKYTNRWSFALTPGSKQKSGCLVANVSKGIPYNVVCEPVGTTEDGKSFALTASYDGAAPWNTIERHQRSMVAEPTRVGLVPHGPEGEISDSQQYRVYSPDGKNVSLKANGGGWGAKTGLCAVPVNTTADGKAQCLRATCYKDGIRNIVANDVDRRTGVAVPICVNSKSGRAGIVDAQPSRENRVYSLVGKGTAVTAGYSTNVAIPIAGRIVGRRINAEGHRDDYNEELEHIQRYEVNENPQKTNCVSAANKGNMAAESATVLKAIPEIVSKYGHLPEMFNAYNRAEINDKAPTLSTGSMVTSSCAVNRLQAVAAWAVTTEFDEEGNPIKAKSGADGKEYTVYKVAGGQITIKGKAYPIKLADGYYIIRKLTVSECKRLQTVPEWYDFSCVSNTQAYKMLGNGWTVAVIVHLIKACLSQI